MSKEKKTSARSTKATSKKRATPETPSAAKKRRAVEIMRDTLCNITEVCNAVGIDRKTFYTWKEKDPDFAAKIAACYEHRLDVAEAKLQEKIGEGSETSLIFFLKTQGKARGYVEKTESAVSVDANVTAKISGLTDEELQKKLDEITKKLK